jgi:uncharacterized protein (DUF924 family)
MQAALAGVLVTAGCLWAWRRRRRLERRSTPRTATTSTVSPEAEALAWRLLHEWYECRPNSEPRLAAFATALDDVGFDALWERLWFAKGAAQQMMDAELARTFGTLFDVPEEDVVRHAAGWPAERQLLWHWAWMILSDQISRNIFRRTPRAYATDARARAIARSLQAQWWPLLPLPMRASLALVFIHSEDARDVPTLDSIMDEARAAGMEAQFPSVWGKLSAIADNYKHLLRTFGRIPERNEFLGRPSTDEEKMWGF